MFDSDRTTTIYLGESFFYGVVRSFEVDLCREFAIFDFIGLQLLRIHICNFRLYCILLKFAKKMTWIDLWFWKPTNNEALDLALGKYKLMKGQFPTAENA